MNETYSHLNKLDINTKYESRRRLIKPTIVIVNFNSIGLKTLIRRINHHPFSIVISDNSGELKGTFSRYKDVKVIKNPKNIGFSAGCNVGIKYALLNNATHIVLLNPDIELKISDIRKLIKEEKDINGPVFEYDGGKKKIYDLGGKVNKLVGRAHHIISSENVKGGSYTAEYISGALMVIPTKVFKKIGLFDERFFLYYEDTDFCLRATNAGFKIKINSSVVVRHRLSETIGQNSLIKHYHNIRSNFIFISKNINTLQKPIAYTYLITLAFWVFIKYFLARIGEF